MAKLILNTSLADSTYTVEYKSIDVDMYKKLSIESVDLIITSTNDRVIDAKNFSHGILSNFINKIEFYNTNKIIDSSNRITAKVFLNPIKINKQVNVVLLPISGKSTIFNNSYKLVESLPVNENVFTKEHNSFDNITSIVNNAKNITHTISGIPKQRVKVLSRSFTVPNGYHFPTEPKYKIIGDINRYSMSSNLLKDDKNRIIGKNFNLYYHFPNFDFANKNQDYITFTFKPQKIKVDIEKQINDEMLPQQIYSLDTGPALTSVGGEKRIRVTGVPGSTFKIIVQDSDKKVYNFKTGIFEAGGDLLIGEIPKAKKGIGYGEWRTIVEVPTSTSGSEITVNLIKDQAVDHSLLADQFDKTKQIAPSQKIAPSKVADVIMNEGDFVFSLKDGGESGFDIQRPLFFSDSPSSAELVPNEASKYFKNGTYTIGSELYGKSIEEYINDHPFILQSGGKTTELAWLITTSHDAKYIRINREPLFDQGGTYYRWDSAYSGEDDKEHTSAGVVISTDWGTSVRHSVTSDTSDGTTLDFKSSSLRIAMSITGQGKGIAHGVSGAYDELAYSSVLVSIKVSGTFGTGTVSPELNIKNFLSIYTLS